MAEEKLCILHAVGREQLPELRVDHVTNVVLRVTDSLSTFLTFFSNDAPTTTINYFT